MNFFYTTVLASCVLGSLTWQLFGARANPTSPCDVRRTETHGADPVTKTPLQTATHPETDRPSNISRADEVNDVSDDADSCDDYSTRVLTSMKLVRNAVDVAFSKACSTLCSHYPNKCRSSNFCDVIKERARNAVHISEWPQNTPIPSLMPAVGHLMDLLACLEIAERNVKQAPVSFLHQVTASFNRTRTEVLGLNIAKEELVFCSNIPAPVGQCRSDVTLTDPQDPYTAVINGLYVLVWVSNDMTTMIQQASK